MSAKRMSLPRLRIPLIVLCSALVGSAVSAQTPQPSETDLQTTLRPGMTVWITESGGREEKTRIVGVSGGIVTTTVGENIRRVRAQDIRRARVRRSDTIIDGAVIGAGAALASGLAVCRLTDPGRSVGTSDRSRGSARSAPA